jgi:chemotaxis protein histidine kinase CheA
MSDQKRKRLTSKIATDIVKVANKAETRDLSDAGPYDPSKLEHIKSLLHGLSVALGTLSSAQRELTTLKGHEISPDGKLGGKGYVMTLRKFKDLISDSVNNLSDLTDTLADEVTNPRWGLSSEQIQSILDEKDEAEEKASEEADSYFTEADKLMEESEAESPEEESEVEAPEEESEEESEEEPAEEEPAEEEPAEESEEEESEEELEKELENPSEEQKSDEDAIPKESREDLIAGLLEDWYGPKTETVKKASFSKQKTEQLAKSIGRDSVSRILRASILTNLIKREGE